MASRQDHLETEREFKNCSSPGTIGLLVLLAYYAIPAGRNLKGIILGYGVFLFGTNLVQLTLRDFLETNFNMVANISSQQRISSFC